MENRRASPRGAQAAEPASGETSPTRGLSFEPPTDHERVDGVLTLQPGEVYVSRPQTLGYRFGVPRENTAGELRIERIPREGHGQDPAEDGAQICPSCGTDTREGQHQRVTASDSHSITMSCIVPFESKLPRRVQFVRGVDGAPEWWYRP